jgi:hypothetical protein
MKNSLDRFLNWIICGHFAIKGIFFKQNHHPLDHLDVILTEPYKSNIHSYLTEYVINVAENPQYLDFVVKNYPLSIGPVWFPLDEVKRSLGPEKDKPIFEPRILFELVILHKIMEIRRGWKPPPILTVYSMYEDKLKLHIADGSHRYEALIRSGYKDYYLIISYNSSNEEDLNEYICLTSPEEE